MFSYVEAIKNIAKKNRDDISERYAFSLIRKFLKHKTNVDIELGDKILTRENFNALHQNSERLYSFIYAQLDTCNKSKFTKEQARKYVAGALLSFKAKRKEKRYYYCKTCDAYHLSSLKKFKFNHDLYSNYEIDVNEYDIVNCDDIEQLKEWAAYFLEHTTELKAYKAPTEDQRVRHNKYRRIQGKLKHLVDNCIKDLKHKQLINSK